MSVVTVEPSSDSLGKTRKVAPDPAGPPVGGKHVTTCYVTSPMGIMYSKGKLAQVAQCAACGAFL